MSVPEAAAALQWSDEWVRQLFHQGVLAGEQLTKPNGRIRICPCSVQRLLDAAPNTPRSTA